MWVGDPNGYTPMVNVPEFGGRNASRVQGGRYPTQIWKTFMDPAHAEPADDRLGRHHRSRPVRRPACTCRATSAWPQRVSVRAAIVVGTVPPGGRAGGARRVRQPGPTAAATCAAGATDAAGIGDARPMTDSPGAGLTGHGRRRRQPPRTVESGHDGRRPTTSIPSAPLPSAPLGDRRHSVLTDDLLALQATTPRSTS